MKAFRIVIGIASFTVLASLLGTAAGAKAPTAANPFGEIQQAEENSTLNMHLCPEGKWEVAEDRPGEFRVLAARHQDWKVDFELYMVRQTISVRFHGLSNSSMKVIWPVWKRMQERNPTRERGTMPGTPSKHSPSLTRRVTRIELRRCCIFYGTGHTGARLEADNRSGVAIAAVNWPAC